jgi:hypothetical protein
VKIEDWTTPDGRKTVREWRCCGFVWQMIITPVWPGSFWNTTCPKCGETMEPPPVPMDRPDFLW